MTNDLLLETLYDELDEHVVSLERGLLELEATPTNDEVLATVFRAAHSIKGATGTFGLDDIARFTHALEGVLESLRAGTRAYDADTAGMLLRSLDQLRAMIDAAREGAEAPASDALRAELDAILHAGDGAKGDASAFEIFGDDDANANGAPVKAAPAVAPQPQEQATPQAATIRVTTEKLDRLLDLVGELVISQAVIRDVLREVATGETARLNDALTAMDRNTRELQERVMAIRMVPLSSVFQRLPRMVRDLADASGKRVRLVIEGEGTEIDKGMVEQLADPMTHLVRNAIDHGLEPPEERVAKGKPEVCTLAIRASHQGGNVVIEVEDDGRGLSTEAIRAKAIQLGILTPEVTLPDEDVHQLIFTPGFSTAQTVTSVSGRGVGMDVVKRNVEALNGSLALGSERGRGTHVKLRLPLTLAILDGLAVRVGQQTFIVPLLCAIESFRPANAQLHRLLCGDAQERTARAPQIIDVRGTSLPVVRLHELFGVPDAVVDPCAGIVCVLEADGARFAVLVDEILGQRQVVVKNLESSYGAVDGVMGATILGNGRVAMIVDAQALARSVRTPPKGRSPSPLSRSNRMGAACPL